MVSKTEGPRFLGTVSGKINVIPSESLIRKFNLLLLHPKNSDMAILNIPNISLNTHQILGFSVHVCFFFSVFP